MTSPGQKDSHTKWERQEMLGRNTTAASKDEEPKIFIEKRWTVQQGPFRGFNSPPGRF